MIRPYRETDHAAVYDVCVRTADVGGDARGKYHTDDLMPDLFAGPYVFLEPEFAFVLDDGQRAVGYVIGTRTRPRSPAPAGRAGSPGSPAAIRSRRTRRPARRRSCTPCTTTRSGWSCPAWRNTRPTCTSTCCRRSRSGGHGRALHGDVLRRRGAGRSGRGACQRDHRQHQGARLLRPSRLRPAGDRRTGRAHGDRARPQALRRQGPALDQRVPPIRQDRSYAAARFFALRSRRSGRAAGGRAAQAAVGPVAVPARQPGPGRRRTGHRRDRGNLQHRRRRSAPAPPP